MSQMSTLFNKPVAEMDEMESSYFQMEVGNAINNIIRLHSSKGPQFLMALSIALRDQAGRGLYAKNQPKPNRNDNSSNNNNSGSIWS